jgi:hypothetical protein
MAALKGRKTVLYFDAIEPQTKLQTASQPTDPSAEVSD